MAVTVLTERAEAPEVRVAVTGYTLRPCTREHLTTIRAVTALTRQEIMRATERKRTKVMIDSLVALPGVHRVTLSAIRSLTPLVNVEMTARALSVEPLILVIEVTLLTLYSTMLTLEFVFALYVMVKGDE